MHHIHDSNYSHFEFKMSQDLHDALMHIHGIYYSQCHFKIMSQYLLDAIMHPHYSYY